jgi:hypothetical protein
MFPGFTPQLDPNRSGITAFNLRATPLFEQVSWQGSVYRLLAKLTHRRWRLLTLREALAPDMTRRPGSGAVQEVDLSSIVGSIDRSEDFDRHFCPLHDRLQSRWVRVASMMLQRTPLPPVELVRVRDAYFVVDGHHRISVARALDYASIDAVLSAVYD